MATNQTEHYELNQWLPTDPVIRTDFNEDNAKIEAALAALEEGKASLDLLYFVAEDVGKLRTQVNDLEDLVESLQSSL